VWDLLSVEKTEKPTKLICSEEIEKGRFKYPKDINTKKTISNLHRSTRRGKRRDIEDHLVRKERSRLKNDTSQRV